MKKLERIESQAQKAREKIAAMQALLKEIDGKRTEQENLQIVQKIRALKLSRDELYGFLSDGELPASLAEAFSGDTAAEPETVYSRKDKKKRKTEPDGTGDTTAPDFDNSNSGDTPHYESEGMNNEE